MSRSRSASYALAIRGLLALGILFSAGCASSKPRLAASTLERGVASWYGPGFHGRATASGERYDMHQLTAAHLTLPFGTLVEVRNLTNGLTTQVRINDRGPFRKNRIVDLSNAAARAIDMVGPGTALVELRVLAFADIRRRYVVQVGAFQERGLAESLSSALCGLYPEVAVHSDEVWHRVQVGEFDDRDEAESIRRRLERAGYPALVIVAATLVAPAPAPSAH